MNLLCLFITCTTLKTFSNFNAMIIWIKPIRSFQNRTSVLLMKVQLFALLKLNQAIHVLKYRYILAMQHFVTHISCRCHNARRIDLLHGAELFVCPAWVLRFQQMLSVGIILDELQEKLRQGNLAIICHQDTDAATFQKLITKIHDRINICSGSYFCGLFPSVGKLYFSLASETKYWKS